MQPLTNQGFPFAYSFPSSSTWSYVPTDMICVYVRIISGWLATGLQNHFLIFKLPLEYVLLWQLFVLYLTYLSMLLHIFKFGEGKS